MSNQSFQFAFKTFEDLSIVTNFTPFDEVSFQTPNSGLIAIYIFLLVLHETLGNFLLFCLIWYEKYGMDSQKRTVTNQLLSSMCMAQILHNIFIMPLFTISMIIGFQSKFSTLLPLCPYSLRYLKKWRGLDPFSISFNKWCLKFF